MNNYLKILTVSTIVALSLPVQAQEYDNHYVDYMYENYVGKKRARPVEFDVMEQSLQINKQIIIPSVTQNQDYKNITTTGYKTQTNYQNTNSAILPGEKNEYFDYLGFGIGISKFNEYKVSQGQYNMNQASMDADANEFMYFLSMGWKFDNWNVDTSLDYVNYSEIITNDENPLFLLDYNQSMKILSLGVNASYNLFGATESGISPFIGVGAGYSQFKISDYAQRADLVKVTTGPETLYSGFLKFMFGTDIKFDTDRAITIAVDYRLYQDIDTKYIYLQDLSGINTMIGLKIDF